MKKVLVLLFLLFLVACGDSYDKEAFEEVDAYSQEMIPAMDVALSDLDAWASDLTEENAEKVDKSMQEVADIRDQYWNDGEIQGTSLEEIDEWMIKMSRGDTEWTIEGEEFADALYEVHANSEELPDRAEMIHDEDIESDDIQSLANLARMSRESIDELRRILYNQ